MKILIAPQKILSTPTQPVEQFDAELKDLVNQMEETLKNQHDPEGVGLSANQVGVPLRVAVVRLNYEDPRTSARFIAVVNPQITRSSPQSTEEYEGCLSLPHQYALVSRAAGVTVEAQDLQGNPIKLTPQGFLARIFQHEIDHLNGKLITDRARGKVLTEEEFQKLVT